MGRQSFFLTFPTTDRDQVLKLWHDYCMKDTARQRSEAIAQFHKEQRGIVPGTRDWGIAIEEYIIYNASPLSFDSYRIDFVDKPDFIQDENMLKEWILQTHQKWDPALAVAFEGKTIIGGWVSI
jgi:hypothetical protein